jgi:hypothetical protein
MSRAFEIVGGVFVVLAVVAGTLEPENGSAL